MRIQEVYGGQRGLGHEGCWEEGVTGEDSDEAERWRSYQLMLPDLSPGFWWRETVPRVPMPMAERQSVVLFYELSFWSLAFPGHWHLEPGTPSLLRSHLIRGADFLRSLSVCVSRIRFVSPLGIMGWSSDGDW